MRSRVVTAFRAVRPADPSSSRVFEPGDILRHVDYASGAVSLFEPQDSTELYEIPMHEFKQFTELISFDEEEQDSPPLGES
jgi:hypothetical protein